eukprot:GEMP01046904.1.p1 GENE.GEMP01046904.1~~GEMP01046904.1.p1  ORF type:complete len:295 (+),score=71.51 GEMP01046904.1:145-1029(+)
MVVPPDVLVAARDIAQSQLVFDGTAVCDTFVPLNLKADLCQECYKSIAKHRRDAVDPSDIPSALEYSVPTIPSEIIPAKATAGDVPEMETDTETASGSGGLLCGGFKAAINNEFMRTHGITHVVCAMGGVMQFANLFGQATVRAFNEMRDPTVRGLTVLDLEWDDSVEQRITLEELREAVLFIHHARLESHSVLVHCAQGRSRSAAVCVAYVMALHGAEHDDVLTSEAALEIVRQKRNMASPNVGFMMQLKKLEKHIHMLLQEFQTQIEKHTSSLSSSLSPLAPPRLPVASETH